MKNRTLPYGYCCVDGKITVHSSEAEILAEIYKNYLDGKSLLTIAEHLNDRKIEYMPSVIGWNKARLKRILEDERYMGNEQYPCLIDEETHNAVLSVKSTRNTQKNTDRQAGIYQLSQIADTKQKRENAQSRLDDIYTILDGLKNHPMEYDDRIVRQIIECVVIESKEEIKVIFIGGLETTERLKTDCAQ